MTILKRGILFVHNHCHEANQYKKNSTSHVIDTPTRIQYQSTVDYMIEVRLVLPSL